MSQDSPGDFAVEADQAAAMPSQEDLAQDLSAHDGQAHELPELQLEPTIEEPTWMSEPLLEPAPVPEPQPAQEPDGAALQLAEPEAQPETPLTIPVAEPAPLAVPARTPNPSNEVLGLPLQLLNQLLARLGSVPLNTLADLLPALRLVALLLLAGFVLRLTGATLGALNEIPMLGRLLELVGLISALNFLARNALRSQKRAELLARIQKLKREFLG